MHQLVKISISPSPLQIKTPEYIYEGRMPPTPILLGRANLVCTFLWLKMKLAKRELLSKDSLKTPDELGNRVFCCDTDKLSNHGDGNE